MIAAERLAGRAATQILDAQLEADDRLAEGYLSVSETVADSSTEALESLESTADAVEVDVEE